MIEHDVQHIAELISNGLSVPVIILCFSVAALWFKPAVHALKPNGKPTTAQQWFIIGVFFSFFGEIVDNLYWTVAWSVVYLDMPNWLSVVESGVFANIPFRQLLGIFAAYCHINSAYAFINNGEHNKSNKILTFSIVGGIIFAGILFLLRNIL